jgi:hypothetical protein
MKVRIVGTGLAGSTAGYALVMQGVGRELVQAGYPFPLSEEEVQLRHSAEVIRGGDRRAATQYRVGLRGTP